VSVDIRTRTDGEQAAVGAARFFGQVLPAAFDAGAERLAEGVRHWAPRATALTVGGETWTLVADADAGRVNVEPGRVDGAGVVLLDDQQLDDLANDQGTPMGWFSSGALRVDGARLDQLLDWWVLVRAALDDRVPYTPGSVDLVAADGGPLDLSQSFRVDDPVDAQRDFLERAGFLHLVDVFTEDEMAAVSADMDAASPRYSPDDGRSWWARTSDGTNRLVRMQGFDEQSDTVAHLVQDDRLLGIGDITGDGHTWGGRSWNRIEALVKPVGVVEGISDVPWHKDCSLGRHSYDCCSLTVGISVTGADASSGQLRVVAGSHRALVWPALRGDDLDLPVVDLPTRTGDVTIHLSCTLHMAQPPIERERRVMYTGFRLPPRNPEASRAALQRLNKMREAAPVTVSQPASPVA
jgi:hypothetical protein